MKVSSRWFIAGLACVVVLAALAAFKFFQIRAAIAYGESFPEPSESVEAVAATVSTFHRSFSTIGEIVAPQSLELRNEVEGVVAEVNFSSGDRVNKGDVLVQLDVSEERARLKAAEAREELARLDLDRVTRLAKKKSVSEEAVDQSRANFDIAKADVKALEAVIAKKTLRAPFDAVTGIHSLDVGEYLKSDTPIVSLVGVNDYSWLDFNVPLAQGGIKIGTKVTVTLPGLEQKTVSAVVIAREPQASATSRNVKLRARIAGELSLPPNAVVNVSVPLGTSEHILLPRIALLVDSRGDYVYVLEKDANGNDYRARRRPVEVGEQNDQVSSVLAGVKAGELVAADGAFKLLPGLLTHVRVRQGFESDSGEQ